MVSASWTSYASREVSVTSPSSLKAVSSPFTKSSWCLHRLIFAPCSTAPCPNPRKNSWIFLLCSRARCVSWSSTFTQARSRSPRRMYRASSPPLIYCSCLGSVTHAVAFFNHTFILQIVLESVHSVNCPSKYCIWLFSSRRSFLFRFTRRKYKFYRRKLRRSRQRRRVFKSQWSRCLRVVFIRPAERYFGRESLRSCYGMGPFWCCCQE